MPKATMSFENSRKALAKQISSKAGAAAVEKMVPFRDDDVPKYLRGLAKFQEQSRKSRLVVK